MSQNLGQATPRLARRRSAPFVAASNCELDAEFALNLLDGHHLDGIPRATVKECAVRALAGTFLAADAEVGVNFDAAKWRVLLVGNPVHAIFDRAVRHARGGARASGAALGNHRQLSGLLLARGIDSGGLRLLFDDVWGFRNEVNGPSLAPRVKERFSPDGPLNVNTRESPETAVSEPVFGCDRLRTRPKRRGWDE